MSELWYMLFVASWEMPWSTGRWGPSPWRWRKVWTKGWESKNSEQHKHTTTGTFRMLPKREPGKAREENSLCQGVVTLGAVIYRIDFGILFLIWFTLHAWVCVCLCVSPYLYQAHVAEYRRDSSPEKERVGGDSGDSGVCLRLSTLGIFKD